MQYAINNRWSGEAQFTAEIDCAVDALESVKRGLAVLWAVKEGTNLSETNLSGADLRGADLSGSDLSGSDLSGSDLSGANLSGANLSEAHISGADLSRSDLSEAYLSETNLRGADLSGSDLSEANLRETNLRGADLRGADLSGADLSGSDLSGADLSEAHISGSDLSEAHISGAKWRGDITIQRVPLFLSGMKWPVVILDHHMQIGCELHPLAEWASFDDRRIAAMAGKIALSFWHAHKTALLALAHGDNRGVEKPAEVAA